MLVLERIKKIFPITVKTFLSKTLAWLSICKERRTIRNIHKKHTELAESLKKKDLINTVFLVIHDSVWKYDDVYRILEKHERFVPTIAVIPLVDNGKGDLSLYYKTLKFFRDKSYNVFDTYDKTKKVWLDITPVLKPDIVFFTNPHKITFENYYVDAFENQLTCYVPYSFQVSNLYEMQFNQAFHAKMWKQFYETALHKKIAQKYSRVKGKNVIVTGYPGIDSFQKKESIFESPWIKKDKKNIIWAPHHTIEEGSALGYSTFIKYSGKLLDFVNKSNDYQVVFKPHPLLKKKLYNHTLWGKEKTDLYYKEWDKIENGFFHDSDYKELFYYSDAMIHDSGSFTAEYLVTGKPVIFLLESSLVKENFNEFGKSCLDKHYQGFSWEDVEFFLEEVVKNGNDTMKKEREVFVRKYYIPGNGKTASENIVDELITYI